LEIFLFQSVHYLFGFHLEKNLKKTQKKNMNLLIFICLNSFLSVSAINKSQNKLDELIFNRSTFTRPRKSSSAEVVQSEKDLDQTIQNIIQIDTLSKESVKQFELINDCATKLKSLEIELDLVNTQVNDISQISKTPRYATPAKPLTESNSGRVTMNLVQSVKQTRARTPTMLLSPTSAARSNFYYSQTLLDIRNHFINHLK